MGSHKYRRLLLKALKIAAGSGMAIMAAELLGLSYATSAGIITLLTVQDTRQDTIQLTVDRILSFLLCVGLIYACFHFPPAGWVNYIVYILLMVVCCCLFNWQNTISVNAVMGTHYLMTPDYSLNFALNELTLILIGTGLALGMNWLMPSYRKKIREDVKTAEQGMKRVLTEMAEYLEERKSSGDVWVDLDDLEEVLHDGLRHAHEQVDNTLGEEDYYYADYLEMRLQQCSILQTLRNSVIRIRKVPKQAVYVARYLEYLSECSAEKDSPEEQLWKLEEVLDQMNLEALPRTREEFENRAILFHVLMDLREFLEVKQHFLEAHPRHPDTM